MSLRLINRGSGSVAYREAVKLIQEVTEGADTEFMEYLVQRGITIWQLIPRSIRSWVQFAMKIRAPHFDSITPSELHKAGQEARPDCTCLYTAEGCRWLEASFLPREGE